MLGWVGPRWESRDALCPANWEQQTSKESCANLSAVCNDPEYLNSNRNTHHTPAHSTAWVGGQGMAVPKGRWCGGDSGSSSQGQGCRLMCRCPPHGTQVRRAPEPL